MSIKCKIGFHSWLGCKCSECGKIRSEHHNWKNDCDICSICGKIRDNCHDWLKDCQRCSKCGKTREISHSWEGCRCIKCNITRDEQHDWSRDCEKCKNCSKTRKANHSWDGCKCSKCNRTRDQHHSWKDCQCSNCGKIRNEQHIGNEIKCAKCKSPIEHYWGVQASSNLGQTKEKIVKDLSNKNAIITFAKWQSSTTKILFDLCYSYELRFRESGGSMNLLFLKNGPSLSKMICIFNNHVIFYEYRSMIYYLRPVDDVKSIILYEGSNKDINEYLSINLDQRDNDPVFNSVFNDDPSGIRESLDSTRKVLTFQLLIYKVFALNLIANDSKLFDRDFFNRVKENLNWAMNDDYNANHLFKWILKNDRDIYNMIIERGILYGDVKYVSTFSKIRQ